MIMNGNSWKTAQDYIMNDIMNDIVHDKKGHNIVNGSFADKLEGSLLIAKRRPSLG